MLPPELLTRWIRAAAEKPEQRQPLYAFLLAVVQLSPALKLDFARACLSAYEDLGASHGRRQ